MSDESLIKKILLARYLYGLAEDNIKTKNPAKVATGIILLQDAIETFLLSVSDKVNANVGDNAKFFQYLDEINKKILPKELPMRTRLLQINKMRVNAKHHSITPDTDEALKALITSKDFFEEVSMDLIGVSFYGVSLIDLISEGEVKSLLLEAKAQYEKENYADCLISCRKALYLSIESSYSLEDYKDEKPQGLAIALGDSPYFTKDPEYIEKNVNNPTDFIVYDNDNLEMKLMKYGIEHNDFWNIWRLTPEVIKMKNEEWVIKEEFNKLDDETVKASAEYCLNTTINICLKVQKSKESTQYLNYRKYYCNLKVQEIDVYKKADKDSEVVTKTPKGLVKVYCDFKIRGLNDGDTYWHLSHVEDDVIIFGYIHESSVG